MATYEVDNFEKALFDTTHRIIEKAVALGEDVEDLSEVVRELLVKEAPEGMPLSWVMYIREVAAALGEEGPDPREELARRLAEYALFKEAAAELGQRPILGRDVFEPRPEPGVVPEKEPTLDVSLFALLEALRRVLRSLPPEPVAHEVALERVSVQDRMVFVMDYLRGADRTALFEELLRAAPATRSYLVVTLLAILELASIQALRIFQSVDEGGRVFGPIRVQVRLADAKAAAST